MTRKDLTFYGAVVFLLIVGVIAHACRSARAVPYVRTVGPDGYWNAHYDTVSRYVYLARPGGTRAVGKVPPDTAR